MNNRFGGAGRLSRVVFVRLTYVANLNVRYATSDTEHPSLNVRADSSNIVSRARGTIERRFKRLRAIATLKATGGYDGSYVTRTPDKNCTSQG